MQIVIAPGRLRDGVDEAALLQASERFQNDLVSHHPGVLRRTIVTDGRGRYADIVLLADEAVLGQVMADEEHSAAAQEFMSMWDSEEPEVYRVLHVHE